MSPVTSDLPIEPAIPELLAALARGPNAVLRAPPGAGKTTRVPLALLDQPWAAGKRVIVLEPRRLAARAARRRMATMLGEGVGDTVGYRVRMESRVGPRTRVEVVTDGLFLRRLQADRVRMIDGWRAHAGRPARATMAPATAVARPLAAGAPARRISAAASAVAVPEAAPAPARRMTAAVPPGASSSTENSPIRHCAISSVPRKLLPSANPAGPARAIELSVAEQTSAPLRSSRFEPSRHSKRHTSPAATEVPAEASSVTTPPT
jgi:hypothetical protein